MKLSRMVASNASSLPNHLSYPASRQKERMVSGVTTGGVLGASAIAASIRRNGRCDKPVREPQSSALGRLLCLVRSSCEKSIQAPRAAAREREIEKDETIKDRGVPTINHWEERARRMAPPIRDRHFARQNEGDRAGEQAEHQQRAADQLEKAAEAGHRPEFWSGPTQGRKIERLLRAVLHEDQRGHDAQDREYAGRPHRCEPVAPLREPIARAGSKFSVLCCHDGLPGLRAEPSTRSRARFIKRSAYGPFTIALWAGKDLRIDPDQECLCRLVARRV